MFLLCSSCPTCVPPPSTPTWSLPPGSKLTCFDGLFLVSYLSFIPWHPVTWKPLFCIFCPGFLFVFSGRVNLVPVAPLGWKQNLSALLNSCSCFSFSFQRSLTLDTFYRLPSYLLIVRLSPQGSLFVHSCVFGPREGADTLQTRNSCLLNKWAQWVLATGRIFQDHQAMLPLRQEILHGPVLVGWVLSCKRLSPFQSTPLSPYLWNTFSFLLPFPFKAFAYPTLLNWITILRSMDGGF